MKLPELDLLSTPRAVRLGTALAWGTALAVTAWVAADLFWRFSAPPAPALPVASVADPQRAAEAIASRHLMGQPAAGSAAAAPVATTRHTLQAVVTGSGGRPGWAIIAIDGGAQQGFVEGQEIRPGVTLAAVRGDAVELSTGGMRQTLRLAERSVGSGAPSAGQPSPPLAPPAPPAFGDATAPDAAQRTLAPGFPTNFQAQPIPSPSNQ